MSPAAPLRTCPWQCQQEQSQEEGGQGHQDQPQQGVFCNGRGKAAGTGFATQHRERATGRGSTTSDGRRDTILSDWKAQLKRHEEEEVNDNHGFGSDLSSSIRQNLQRVLGDTLSSTYFGKPQILEFCGFTPGRKLSSATQLILGLSFKLVSRPITCTTRKSHGGF